MNWVLLYPNNCEQFQIVSQVINPKHQVRLTHFKMKQPQVEHLIPSIKKNLKALEVTWKNFTN